MPIVPSNYTNPTGKYNAIASLQKWLTVNVPAGSDFTYFFTPDLKAAVFPRVELSEFQFPDVGNTAYGGVIFPEGQKLGLQGEGKLSQTMLMLDIFTALPDKNAKQKLYEIRDRLMYALRNAGRSTDLDATEILPPIKVLWYNSGGSPTDTETVARVPIEEDNATSEQYFPPTAEQPNVHQLRVLAKFQWWEMWA